MIQIFSTTNEELKWQWITHNSCHSWRESVRLTSLLHQYHINIIHIIATTTQLHLVQNYAEFLFINWNYTFSRLLKNFQDFFISDFFFKKIEFKRVFQFQKLIHCMAVNMTKAKTTSLRTNTQQLPHCQIIDKLSLKIDNSNVITNNRNNNAK